MEKITFDNNDDEKSQKPIYLDEKSNDDINSHGDNPNKDSHNFTGPTKENTGGKITEIKKRNSKKDFIISEKKEENETNKQNDNRDENNIEFMSNILTDNIKSSFNEEDEKEKEEENNNCNNNSLENNDFERVSSKKVKEKEKEKDDDYTILKNKAKEKRLKRLQKKRKRSIQKTPKKKM
jgi:Ca-activated chloride channel family protein